MEDNILCPTLCSKDYYFDSYAHFGIHEEMLKDEVIKCFDPQIDRLSNDWLLGADPDLPQLHVAQ